MMIWITYYYYCYSYLFLWIFFFLFVECLWICVDELVVMKEICVVFICIYSVGIFVRYSVLVF